jgi:hypothetical protein
MYAGGLNGKGRKQRRTEDVSAYLVYVKGRQGKSAGDTEILGEKEIIKGKERTKVNLISQERKVTTKGKEKVEARTRS